MAPSIWKSRKFWLAVADAVFSITGIVLTSVLAPDKLALALNIIGVLQPVLIAVIVSYTVEDVAAINAGLVK